MLDSTPQSPTPNLTRTGSSISTPERSASPIKGIPFPASAVTPAKAEMSTVSAQGENGLWDDEDQKDLTSRARRELSVIEESSSIAQKEDVDTLPEHTDESHAEEAENDALESHGIEHEVRASESLEDAEEVEDDSTATTLEPGGAHEQEAPKPPVISVTT